MTIRDLQADFSNTGAAATTSIIGTAGTYLCANSVDTSPLGAYLTSLTANDTQLSANVNTGRDLGGGEPIKLVIDWITAAVGGTSVDVSLITSASAQLGTPTTILDFTAVVTATLVKGYRQIITLPRSAAYLQWLGVQAVTVGTYSAGSFIAFLTHDVDSVVQGYASGFSLK